MPLAGFKPTIAVLEWGKKCHTLDRVATVLDYNNFSGRKFPRYISLRTEHVQRVDYI
jgi:hypothetical protein